MNTIERNNMLEWRKCNSVTTGGKPFFMYARTDRINYWVSWDRCNKVWEMSCGRGNGELQSCHSTLESGMEAAELHAKENGEA